MSAAHIANARVFDGTQVLDATTLTLNGQSSTAVDGTEAPHGADVVELPALPCCPASSTATSTPRLTLHSIWRRGTRLN